MLKRLIIGTVGVLMILAGALVFNTLQFKSRQLQVSPVAPIPVMDDALDHLSQAVQFATVSYDDSTHFSPDSFREFLDFLQETYPLCDSLLTKSVINRYSLLYHWKGRDNSLQPILLTAHYDVVPANPSEWTEAPFGGKIDSEYIWGRGTMDDKLGVIGILEAVETLLKEGFIPQRSIYLAFGHDEEIMGLQGAVKIAAYLRNRDIRFEYVVDEGLLITRGIVPGLEKEVALIGLSEKGFLTVTLETKIEGGHASMPQEETAIDVLAKAVLKLRRQPRDARVCEPVRYFLDFIGPEMPFLQRIVFANIGLFEKLILKIYEKTPAGNALVRTTIAPTIFRSGTKENVLPGSAAATLNIRILPGESTAELLEAVTKVIDDERIVVSPVGVYSDPSPVSSTEHQGFYTIEKSIGEVFPESLLAASLMIAATDSRHYTDLAEDIYRFSPQTASAEDLQRIHGRDERIAKEDFKNCIRFYRQLIVNANP